MTPSATESQTQRAILDLLAAKRIMAFRMNSGAVTGSHKGKRWCIHFGQKGMADILVFVRTYSLNRVCGPIPFIEPLWIECKSPSGKQSSEQIEFEKYVKSNGHEYLLARSVDDVVRWLEEKGL